MNKNIFCPDRKTNTKSELNEKTAMMISILYTYDSTDKLNQFVEITKLSSSLESHERREGRRRRSSGCFNFTNPYALRQRKLNIVKKICPCGITASLSRADTC
jgi:hypothetical protein